MLYPHRYSSPRIHLVLRLQSNRNWESTLLQITDRPGSCSWFLATYEAQKEKLLLPRISCLVELWSSFCSCCPLKVIGCFPYWLSVNLLATPPPLQNIAYMHVQHSQLHFSGSRLLKCGWCSSRSYIFHAVAFLITIAIVTDLLLRTWSQYCVKSRVTLSFEP